MQEKTVARYAARWAALPHLNSFAGLHHFQVPQLSCYMGVGGKGDQPVKRTEA